MFSVPFILSALGIYNGLSYLCDYLHCIQSSLFDRLNKTRNKRKKGIYIVHTLFISTLNTTNILIHDTGENPENQRRRVSDSTKAWKECSNVTFKLVNSLPADVCITFIGSYPYITSVTGMRTTGKKNLTMCLVGTADNNALQPSENGSIVHEFKRLLGLGHEHMTCWMHSYS
jgi:hypothetical protein